MENLKPSPRCTAPRLFANMFESRVALAPVYLLLAMCVPASCKRWLRVLSHGDEPEAVTSVVQYFLYVQSLPTDAPANMEKEQTAERTGSSPDTGTQHNRKLQERLAQIKVRSVVGLPRDSKLNDHSL